jgi:hypothetical protein
MLRCRSKYTRNNVALIANAPSRSRDAYAPELCMLASARKGAGNAGCLMHPQSRVRK